MTDISFAPAKLPVIATFEKTCRAFLKALGPLALLILLAIGVFFAGFVAMAIPLGGLAFALQRGLGLDPGSLPFGLAMAPLSLLFIGVFIALALRFAIAQYKVAESAAEGRNLKFMDILRDPKPSLVSYFLLTLVVGIFTLLGMILFIVPGIMIALALCMAPMAMIFEGKDVGGALQRSRDLTRDNRWRLLGLFILSGLVFFPAFLLTSPPLESDPDVALSPLAGVFFLLNLLVSFASSIFTVVLAVTIYRELRALKDDQGEAATPEPSGAD
ncbi:MAG: YciC family protein [Phenylobacterium sp.]